MTFDAKHKKSPQASYRLRRRGPSGAIRTPGPVNPNHVRYQLRYTRIFCFAVVAIMVKRVVVRQFYGEMRRTGNAESPVFMRLSVFCPLRAPPEAYTLPKQAPYQLGYTRRYVFTFSKQASFRLAAWPFPGLAHASARRQMAL